MDTAANPVPDSRNLRRRRNPRNIQNAQIRRRSPVIVQEEEDAMKDHRLFHKRAAQAVEVVTVDVVATVDDNGNVIAATTLQPGQPAPTTQAAEAPAAAPAQAQPASPAPPPAVVPVVQDAVPTVADAPIVVAAASDIPAVTAIVNSIPVVPSVPPFPTDLVVPSVPAFPFASPATPAEVPASTAAPAPASSAAAAAPDAASNSTMTSTSLASATDLSSSDSASRTGSASLSTHLSSHTTTASNARSSATDSSAAFTATQSVTGGVLGVPGAPGATNSPIADATTNKSPTPLETPQVVGSVVGSLAGAALILAIILLLLRRHKRRRGGALQLTGDDRSDHNHQPMAAKSAPLAFVPNAFLNRFSSMSRSTVESNTSTGEKSFQRLHGRKLPSAWSEGMTSDQFSRGGGTLSGSSFYQDDQGTYGGPGLPKDFEKEIGGVSNARASGPMSFRPSPARTPVISNPDDPSFWGRGNTHLSPPQSPNREAPRGTLGRSLPSQDGSRSSRFTENV